MITELLPLAHGSPGSVHQLTVHRFGSTLAGPKSYLQAGLHADEAPGMLVLQVVLRELKRLEAQGQLAGEVVVVPMANPIGLGQFVQGQQFGRFALSDGVNFNRGFSELPLAWHSISASSFGTDADTNTATLRQRLVDACQALQPAAETDSLRQLLLGLALPCDTVLDLHCDGESVVHLYTATHLAGAVAPLAKWMGAQAVLTAEVSGDNPFDEAISRPWIEAKRRWPQVPFAKGGLSVTVELRGEAEVCDELAEQDAAAILAFLMTRGTLAAAAVPQPPSLADPTPTPLAGVEPLTAPIGGVIVFERQPGAQIAAGERVARILNPATGEQRDVCATYSGLLYARVAQRTTLAGRRVAKIASTHAFRSGALLSP